MSKKYLIPTALSRTTMNPNPLEKEIEAKIGQYAKSKGCLYYKFTSPANRAVPDRMIITPNGVVGFLEVKRKGERPTPLQDFELQRLKRLKANAAWCDSVDDGIWFVGWLLERREVEPVYPSMRATDPR